MNLNAISAMIFKICGVEPLIARNGQECLDLLREDIPDIILMDIQMPVMNGVEATERIRNSNKYRSIPIVGITA